MGANWNTIFLAYYQWVPLVLCAQCALFVVPPLVWQLFRHRAHLDLNAVLTAASQAGAATDTDLRNRYVVFSARLLERAFAKNFFGI